MSTETKDVLEQNVSTLIESGGEAPKLGDVARTRIRAELVAKFGVAESPKTRARTPLVAIGFGLAATAAAALVATHFVGHDSPAITDGAATTLADGSTFITAPGATVSVLGPRRVRVDGAALLDVVPGKGTFVVETTRGRIEVLGTRFMVDGQADRTTTAVVRGEVKLATSSGDVVLHAGEQGVAEPGRPPVRGPAPRLSHLVSWAEHARHTDEHALEPLHHGTLFARDPGVRSHPPWGQEYPLPITQLGLDIVIEDQVARVALDQTFHNNANQDLEGVYRFAIPADAALQRLAMYVDGKLTESAVVERMQARRIYEELVYRRVDPALLEWAGSGRLSLRVYPIPANQDKRLMLAYTESLPKLYDDWTLTVPLPEVDQPVGAMDIAVRVKGCANCELVSTSHHIDVERVGDDAIVHYHHTAEKLGDSFVLHVRDTKHATTLATAADGDDHYLMVRAPVKLGTDAPAYRPRTWVILDDVSASRGPAELHAQQDLVDAFVRELDENDKLAVIAFDVDARQKLAPTRVMDVDRKALRASLKREGGVGATDFGVALDAATKLLAGVAPDDAMIVYLGDGMITSGARNLDALRAQIAGKAHFVGVGVGDGPDLQTLGGLATATGGYATTMDLADDLGWRAFDLVAALHTSRVTGLEAKLVDGGGNLVPATAYLGSQQLADGEELELVGKLAGGTTPTAVELTGTVAGSPWHTTIVLPAAPHTAAGYLPRLWAQHHIAARLLAKHEPVVIPPCDTVPATAGKLAVTCPTEAELREARDEQIRREVVALGKRYFLLSRHTSLLVLENDAMYAQYNVIKGSGDTWAPYAMPSTIPVKTTATPPTIAEDAELLRTPLQIFYNPVYYNGFDGVALGQMQTFQTNVWHGNRGGEFEGPPAGTTRGALRITSLDSDRTAEKDQGAAIAPLQQVVTTGDLAGAANGEFVGGIGFGKSGYAGRREWGHLLSDKNARWSGGGEGGGSLALSRFTYAADVAFDDLSGFVPALFSDATDTLRAGLAPTKGTHTIDDAARALLADARRRLPVGVYRWGDRELAVDAARRIGWRRTTEAGLGETASLDGTTWTRRYAELGLDVTRPVGDDDLAVALIALPVWIADPAHYARYFDVTARGRDVVLSTQVRGKPQTAYVMSFDDQARLVAIADAKGTKLVEVTWSATGPVAARTDGTAISVGFTGQAIADATTWAHEGTQPGTLVALPGHLVAYWTAAIDKETAGSPAWRHAERQLLVSAAATQDLPLQVATFDALRTHGGVELGDLVLASAGVARATDDAQFSAAIAPFASSHVGAYVIAGRAYGRGTKAHGIASDGFIGALGHLRSILAHFAAGEAKAAADEIVAMGDRSLELRLVAATASQNYPLDATDVARIWDAVAVGEFKNIARFGAAQAFANRGEFEVAVERISQLATDYDVDARPAQLATAQYYFNSSRRGPAGWQIAWTAWRDRVLASTSYDQVVALVQAAAQQPADLQRVLGRALALADTDARRLAVARLAVTYGQQGLAASIVEPMLKASPSHDLELFASNLALAQGRTAEALRDLEAAQDAGADEVVDINVVRQELGQILNLTQRLAIESSGVDRTHAVDRAMSWGERWRAIDPGNTAIDQQLGELLLAVGDTAGAWRQLSSTIERDPWSGAGYMTVAEAFEHQGKVEAALPFWQQAIVIDQTNPTPRLRKAQALIALGRAREGDVLLHDIATQKWHPIWANVVYQAQGLIARGKH